VGAAAGGVSEAGAAVGQGDGVSSAARNRLQRVPISVMTTLYSHLLFHTVCVHSPSPSLPLIRPHGMLGLVINLSRCYCYHPSQCRAACACASPSWAPFCCACSCFCSCSCCALAWCRRRAAPRRPLPAAAAAAAAGAARWQGRCPPAMKTLQGSLKVSRRVSIIRALKTQ
jgi:hypothetical protein